MHPDLGNNVHLVVIIPCLNEEPTIGEVISGIPMTIRGVDKTEVIVVDDGSSDATVRMAEEHGASVYKPRQESGSGCYWLYCLKLLLEFSEEPRNRFLSTVQADRK